MTSLPAAVRMSIEEYLATGFEPDAHNVHGVVSIEKYPATSFEPLEVRR